MRRTIEQSGGANDDPTLAHISYRYDVKKELLNDPEQIECIDVVLPDGLSARFIRAHRWKPAKTTEVE